MLSAKRCAIDKGLRATAAMNRRPWGKRQPAMSSTPIGIVEIVDVASDLKQRRLAVYAAAIHWRR